MDLYLALFHDTHLVLEKKIGEGTTSVVVLAHEPSTKEEYAVKILPMKYSRYFWREKRALELLGESECSNVIKLHRAVRGKDYLYLVMERGGFDLLTIVESFQKQQKQQLPEQICKELFQQMASVMWTVNKLAYSHHDVKLENFLVDSFGRVKLIDFGYSLNLEEDFDRLFLPLPLPNYQNFQNYQNYDDNENPFGCSKKYIRGDYCAGSPAYASQQLLLQQAHCPEKTDLFSLGVCLYRMICGRFPFCNPDVDSLDVLKKKS